MRRAQEVSFIQHSQRTASFGKLSQPYLGLPENCQGEIIENSLLSFLNPLHTFLNTLAGAGRR